MMELFNENSLRLMAAQSFTIFVKQLRIDVW